MEYKVNYNSHFHSRVKRNTNGNINYSNEYKSFFNFISGNITTRINLLIEQSDYKSVAYWSSILNYFKFIDELKEADISDKWKEALDNGYDLKLEISRQLSEIDVTDTEPGKDEQDIRTKTIYRITRIFENNIKNLNIPDLDEVIPNFIERIVLDIMQNYSPKWINKNNRDVLSIIDGYEKELSQIKQSWLENVKNKSETYFLGLENFVESYIKRSILNKISILINNLISNFTQKTWFFKDKLNSYQIDNLGTEINIYRLGTYLESESNNVTRNLRSILEENFKMTNNSNVEFSLVKISKSAIQENPLSSFKKIDVFLEGNIKFKLGFNQEIIKNWKIKIPDIHFYNPKEEFESLINELVKEINKKKAFTISKLTLVEDKIKNLYDLRDSIIKNGIEIGKTSKILLFKNVFSKYQLDNLRFEFVNDFNANGEILATKNKKIKLEFHFYDSLRRKNDKILSNAITIYSQKIFELEKLSAFLAKNRPKYLFINEWFGKKITDPRKVFLKNNEWNELLKNVGFIDNKKDRFPEFSYFGGSFQGNLVSIFMFFENLIDWRYVSESKYLGWQLEKKEQFEAQYSLKPTQEIWRVRMNYAMTTYKTQKDYMENWIKNKLKVRNSFLENNLEKIKSSPESINYEDVFENLDELDTEAYNLDINYTKKFKIVNKDSSSETYSVQFEFRNSEGEIYTIEKPLFKKATPEQIKEIDNQINAIHNKSLDQLNKINLTKEKEFSKKFQDLYDETQTNYFKNENFLNNFVNEIKLKKILEDYKNDVKETWTDILNSKHLEKVKEIKGLKGATDEEKQKLLKDLDKKLIESLSRIENLNLDYEEILKMLDSVDWNFNSVLNTKGVISRTLKYILASSSGALGLVSAASGAALISLIKSKKKFKKNNLKFKSRKGLMLFTSLIGIGSTIGSVGLSLFVFVSQGGF